MFSSFEFAKKRIIVRLIILFFLIMAIGAFIIIGFLTKTDNVNELKKRMLQAAMIICMTE
ncbi:MAG: hypothetical protein J6O19_04625 [Lachnospira sp.]|nr:hypothetical protein [Lachnospira sp.]